MAVIGLHFDRKYCLLGFMRPINEENMFTSKNCKNGYIGCNVYPPSASESAPNNSTEKIFMRFIQVLKSFNYLHLLKHSNFSYNVLYMKN
jgi:hypothetical protein